MLLKLITCEVLYREMCALVARSPHHVDAEFLTKGLHDLGSKRMLARLQEAVDKANDAKHDAIIFGYALCGNGILGLRARSIPLVIPRAHDCIALFLGSHRRYLEYFDSHPGVYFKTTGWLERGENPDSITQLSIQHRMGMTLTFEELKLKYGEENARYLYEELCNQTRNYGQITFIEMGVEPDGRFERRAREQAETRGWKFEKIQGDMSLLRRLVNGEWGSGDFLLVPPGWQVAPSYDEQIVTAHVDDSQ